MLFGKTMQKVPIVTLLVLASSSMATADILQCTDDIIVLGENEGFTTATESMIATYGTWCEEAEQCPMEISDDLLAAGMAGAADPTAMTSLTDVPPVVGSLDTFFGEFLEDATYKEYEAQCKQAGSSISCADIILEIDGKIAMMDDLEVDVKVTANGFPICLPNSCEVEDTTEIIETLVKQQIKSSPEVTQALEDANFPVATIDVLSIELICATLSIEVCKFVATPVDCAVKETVMGGSSSPASMTTIAPIASSFASLVGVWAMMN